jgi:hypothetical protein
VDYRRKNGLEGAVRAYSTPPPLLRYDLKKSECPMATAILPLTPVC